MKAYIGPYRNYISIWSLKPILEFFCIHDRDSDYICEKLTDTWVDKFLMFTNKFNKEIEYIKTDKWDYWNAHITMAKLCLPIMKQLRLNKHGSGGIKDEDVPEELRSYNAPPKENEWDVDEFWHDRAEWVINEVIWALEQTLDDNWDEKYWIVHPEIDFDNYPEDEGKTSIPLRWKVKGECDWEGRKKHQERIDNGLRLFGTYWNNWWD